MVSRPHDFVVFRRDYLMFGLLAAGTLLLAFMLRYPSLYEPRWYGDEGIFAAVAENVRHGETLYSQAWDNKPPLVFFTYAAIQSVFGTGVFPLHLITTLVVLSTQLVVMLIALALFGRARTLVVGLIIAFVLGTPIIEGNLAMTETFMILPTSLAVLCFVRAMQRESDSFDWYATIGVLIGISAAYKQVAVFDGAAIIVMLWLIRDRPYRAIGAIAAGFVVPQAILASFFIASGAFNEYWYAVVGSLGLYSQLGPSNGPILRAAAYLPALMIVAALVRRRQRGRAVHMQDFPMVWLSFAVVGATSSSLPFPHYLQQAVPPFALALVSNPFAGERDAEARLALALAAVLFVTIVYGQFSVAYRERRQLEPASYYHAFVSHQWGTMSDLDYDYQFDGKAAAVDDIVKAIRGDDEGSTAFAWSELPWIYAAGNLTNPTRFYTSFLGEIVPGAKPEILRDLDAHPPVYIVISNDTYAPFGELEQFVKERYSLVHAEGDWRLYRRSSVPSARSR
jgi:hypothetical protein